MNVCKIFRQLDLTFAKMISSVDASENYVKQICEHRVTGFKLYVLTKPKTRSFCARVSQGDGKER